MKEITPAMTAEEWQLQTTISERCGRMVLFPDGDAGVRVVHPDQYHALAALALYGQPFGFTREDADLLLHGEGYFTDAPHTARERREVLAAKIRALLPR